MFSFKIGDKTKKEIKKSNKGAIKVKTLDIYNNRKGDQHQLQNFISMLNDLHEQILFAAAEL